MKEGGQMAGKGGKRVRAPQETGRRGVGRRAAPSRIVRDTRGEAARQGPPAGPGPEPEEVPAAAQTEAPVGVPVSALADTSGEPTRLTNSADALHATHTQAPPERGQKPMSNFMKLANDAGDQYLEALA